MNEHLKNILEENIYYNESRDIIEGIPGSVIEFRKYLIDNGYNNHNEIIKELKILLDEELYIDTYPGYNGDDFIYELRGLNKVVDKFSKMYFDYNS